MPFPRKEPILFFVRKKHLWFYEKVIWNWYHQKDLCFDWHHICYAWWMCFSTDFRHCYQYPQCSPSRRLVPLSVRGRLHTVPSE